MAVFSLTRPTACCVALLVLQLMTRSSNGFSPQPSSFGTPSLFQRSGKSNSMQNSPLSPFSALQKNLEFPGPSAQQVSRKKNAFQLYEKHKKHESHPEFTYGKFSNDAVGKMEAVGESFKNGVLLVHNNYWDMFWTIYGRALIGMSLASSAAGLAYYINPGFCFSMIQGLVNYLIRIEKVVSNSLSLVKAIPVVLCVIPFMWVMALPSKLIPFLPESDFQEKLLQTVGLPLVQLALWLVRKVHAFASRAEATFITTGGSTILEELASTDPFFFASQVVLVAPIIEELVFRRCLLVFLRKILKRKPRNYLDALEEKRNDLSPWAIVSSIIFASAHVVNWIAPLEGVELLNGKNYAAAMWLSGLAAAQFFTTMVVSLRIFSPIFEEDGLAAAVGAHMMWNFSLLTSFVGLPIRGMKRLFTWVCDQGESESARRWLH